MFDPTYELMPEWSPDIEPRYDFSPSDFWTPDDEQLMRDQLHWIEAQRCARNILIKELGVPPHLLKIGIRPPDDPPFA
jgi:hypothetical protein